MPKGRKVVQPVKGGWVSRDATTGRFSEVRTEKGSVSKITKATFYTIQESSQRRSAALQRLADR